MPGAISSIGGIGGIALPEIRPAAEPGGAGFGSILRDAVNQVEGLRADAGDSVSRLLSGEDEELHTAALATQRAELSFELFLQVRNKVVQAYQEVMRMQV
jgi:flagellar hook-basal body complex protein FliE